MYPLMSTTVETIGGFRFLLKIGLHAVNATPWCELTFFGHSIPHEELLMDCVFHSLTKFLPFHYQYLDIYIRNRNATRLVLFEMRNGFLGIPLSLF